MIPYILHVTVITTVCFLFYKLLLQKETFYRLNRWTLLSCLAVSFALPLLPVPRVWSWREKWKETEVVSTLVSPERAGAEPRRDVVFEPVLSRAAVSQDQSNGPMHHAPAGKGKAAVRERPVDEPMSATTSDRTEPRVERAQAAGNKSSKTTAGTPAERDGAGTLVPFFSGATLLLALQWLFYVYLFGVVVFGANFLLQLAILVYQSYSRPVIKDGRFRIVEISGNRAPCSFGNTIFINPEKYDWETYNQILIHEKIHVSGRHTLDILLAEIALVIQWFNPFAWLYRREVENNLEFLTDAHVLLDSSIERSAYQLSLLRVSAPHLPFSLTNNYNQSLLKRRIVMMNSQSSSLHTVWKYFFLIPLLTGLMCALNKPAIALGAATTKLSMVHAPLFNLIASVADTAKKPARSADTASAAVQKPVKVKTDKGADDEGSHDAEGYGNSSDEGYGYGTAVTISSDNESNSQAIASKIDAYNQTLRTTVAVPVRVKAYRYDNNVSVTYAPAMADPGPVNAKINAAVDAHMLGKVVVADLPRYSFADDTVLTDGAWYATSYGDHLSFELKAGDEDHNWSYTLHVDKSEINPFPGQGNVSFRLVREAGTVEFKGQFDGEEGFGHFHFVPDAAYFPALRQLGVEDIEDRRQFGFFAMNIKKDYVNMLVRNGYPHITQRDLLSFAAMHIDEAYIQYWRGVDLGDGEPMDPRTLIRLKAMRIDRAYVDELKTAGYDHLSLRELETLKAQHIDKAYIQSMGHGPDNQPIPVRELVSYRAMHIDSAYLQSLRKLGYDDLATHDITSLYALHIIPEYIKGFRDIGYIGLSPRDLASLKAMGITPDFVAGFQKLGFDHIPVRTLMQLKATGVTPDYVGKMKARGFDSKDLTKYIRLKNDFN